MPADADFTAAALPAEGRCGAEGSITGRVLAIFVAEAGGEPMQSLGEVRAVAGKGLEGDRYAEGNGYWSYRADYVSQATLVEQETLDALNAGLGLGLSAIDLRRNLVTQGVRLNALVGRDFLVGDVLMRGERLCEPCGYIEKLTGAGVKQALLHRGGLRAYILSEGKIRVGNTIREAEAQA